MLNSPLLFCLILNSKMLYVAKSLNLKAFGTLHLKYCIECFISGVVVTKPIRVLLLSSIAPIYLTTNALAIPYRGIELFGAMFQSEVQHIYLNLLIGCRPGLWLWLQRNINNIIACRKQQQCYSYIYRSFHCL